MTNDTDSQLQYDWNKLAQEALDLWEGHLSSLSSDPKAKEDMAKFIAPLSEMYSHWANMLQANFPGASPFTASTQEPVGAEQEQAAAAPDQPAQESAEAEFPLRDDWANYYADMAGQAAAATTDFVAQQQGLCAAMSATPAKSTPDEAEVVAEVQVKAEAKVELEESGMPVYASSSGGSFTSLQNVEPDYVSQPSKTEVTSVEIPVQQDVPAVARVVDVAAPVAAVIDAPESRSAPAATGPRDLAELASRLAQLERELDGLRRNDGPGAVDDADDADAQRMARARQTGTSF